MFTTDPRKKILGVLEKLLRHHQHPALLEATAALYVDALEHNQVDPEKTVDFLEKAAHREPGSAAIRRLLTQVLADMLRRSNDPKVRSRCMEALEKAVTLRGDELVADKLQLARMYSQAERSDEALAQLGQVSALDADNEEVRAMLGEISPSSAAHDSGDRYDFERIKEEMTKIRGFLAVIVLDRQGAVVTAENKLFINTEELAKSLLLIFSRSRDASRLMELGDFQRGEVEGPMGRLFLAALGTYTLVTVFDTKAKSEAAPSRLEHILASCLTGNSSGGSDS